LAFLKRFQEFADIIDRTVEPLIIPDEADYFVSCCSLTAAGAFSTLGALNEGI